MYGPNHEKTKDFLQKEDKKIKAWNQAAKEFGTGPYCNKRQNIHYKES